MEVKEGAGGHCSRLRRAVDEVAKVQKRVWNWAVTAVESLQGKLMAHNLCPMLNVLDHKLSYFGTVDIILEFIFLFNNDLGNIFLYSHDISKYPFYFLGFLFSSFTKSKIFYWLLFQDFRDASVPHAAQAAFPYTFAVSEYLQVSAVFSSLNV